MLLPEQLSNEVCTNEIQKVQRLLDQRNPLHIILSQSHPPPILTARGPKVQLHIIFPSKWSFIEKRFHQISIGTSLLWSHTSSTSSPLNLPISRWQLSYMNHEIPSVIFQTARWCYHFGFFVRKHYSFIMVRRLMC